jgi:hypothetical protein
MDQLTCVRLRRRLLDQLKLTCVRGGGAVGSADLCKAKEGTVGSADLYDVGWLLDQLTCVRLRRGLLDQLTCVRCGGWWSS